MVLFLYIMSHMNKSVSQCYLYIRHTVKHWAIKYMPIICVSTMLAHIILSQHPSYSTIQPWFAITLTVLFFQLPSFSASHAYRLPYDGFFYFNTAFVSGLDTMACMMIIPWQASSQAKHHRWTTFFAWQKAIITNFVATLLTEQECITLYEIQNLDPLNEIQNPKSGCDVFSLSDLASFRQPWQFKPFLRDLFSTCIELWPMYQVYLLQLNISSAIQDWKQLPLGASLPLQSHGLLNGSQATTQTPTLQPLDHAVPSVKI